VDKPLGLEIRDKANSPNGGVVVSSVSGNAAKAGLKNGDTILWASSFFGDELWPCDKAAFTRSAINATPNTVDFIVVRGKQADEVNVKRLPKRPSPPRFGRKLTASQKETATHLCVDCGFIYFLKTPFEEQPAAYECPQCGAPKSRFAGYDAETGKITSGGGLPQVVSLVGAIGAVGIIALIVVGLQ
jgi:rubredoxin